MPSATLDDEEGAAKNPEGTSPKIYQHLPINRLPHIPIGAAFRAGSKKTPILKVQSGAAFFRTSLLHRKPREWLLDSILQKARETKERRFGLLGLVERPDVTRFDMRGKTWWVPSACVPLASAC